MTGVRRAIVAGIVSAMVATGVAAQQAPVVPQATVAITLQEAVRRALDVQPAMVQARGDQRNAGAGQLSAAGAFLPTITANGSSNLASANRYNPSTGQLVSVPSNTSYSGSLGLSFNLFDGFQRFANKSAASATAA